MDGYLLVLAFAALPAFGNLGGGLLAELVPLSEKALSLALHLAVGVVLAIVGLELMPQAFGTTMPWVPILAFVAGGAAFLGLDRLSGFVEARLGLEKAGGAFGIFSAVALDLFSDGVMIGTGTLIDPTLGFLLALGQVPADVPEGFAAVASARRAGVHRPARVVMALSFAAPILLGATLGFFALRGAPLLLTVSVLAVTAGALTSIVVEEMIPEAHEGETSQAGVLFLLAGFALFALLSVYVA